MTAYCPRAPWEFTAILNAPAGQMRLGLSNPGVAGRSYVNVHVGRTAVFCKQVAVKFKM